MFDLAIACAIPSITRKKSETNSEKNGLFLPLVVICSSRGRECRLRLGKSSYIFDLLLSRFCNFEICTTELLHIITIHIKNVQIWE